MIAMKRRRRQITLQRSRMEVEAFGPDSADCRSDPAWLAVQTYWVMRNEQSEYPTKNGTSIPEHLYADHRGRPEKGKQCRRDFLGSVFDSNQIVSAVYHTRRRGRNGQETHGTRRAISSALAIPLDRPAESFIEIDLRLVA
jgi:hypothetical protein